jgi:HlyD family secretion protein
MKVPRLPILLVLVVVAAAAVGAWWYLRAADQATPDTDSLTLHGNVEIRQVELAFNASERIDRMLVEEGDRVERGQVLAQLERLRLEQAVEQARAQLEAQQAVVAMRRAGPRPQEIQQLRAQVEAAESRAGDAARTAQRLAGMAARELASEEEADHAASVAETARAELNAAQESLQLALAGTRAEEIAAAEAELRARRAGLALAEQRLADATLTAPMDGVVEQRLLQPGDMASPQRPAYTIALTNPLWVRAYVDETDLGRVRPGMRAEVRTDTFPNQVYTAWVGSISPTAEFTPKSVQTREVRTDLVYRVRVFVCNPDGELRLGMPATIDLPLDQPDNGPSVPADHCGTG